MAFASINIPLSSLLEDASGSACNAGGALSHPQALARAASSGVEEATPALISALLQLVEASEALPLCPLPAYLSKAAGLRMLSEPLILAVGSGLYTEP